MIGVSAKLSLQPHSCLNCDHASSVARSLCKLKMLSCYTSQQCGYNARPVTSKRESPHNLCEPRRSSMLASLEREKKVKGR